MALNVKPNTVFTGDCLHILHGFNSECIDLIYLDPPFNSKRMYSAPVGSKAAGASFKDMWSWQDVDEAHLETLYLDYPAMAQYLQSVEGSSGKAMKSYLLYMAQRIIEMHRVLKPTGTLYIHCDTTASHYLKVILDLIFGGDNFRNEIAWCYAGPSKVVRDFPRKHDILLRYAKSPKPLFNENDIRIDHKRQTLSAGATGMARGKRTFEEIREHEAKQIEKGKVPYDWWDDIGAGSHIPKQERTGYPTQKPLKLLERIIKISSNKGDIVLDPFCGCATTMVAADRLERKWIGIDISPKAAELVVERIKEDGGMFASIIHLKSPPIRTDVRKADAKSPDVKQKLFDEQQKKCNGCLEEFEIRNLEVDHIVPKSKGGQDFVENYQLLCGNCNRIKGDRPMEYLRRSIRARQENLQARTYGIEGD